MKPKARKKNAILAIDCQNDFVSPKGSSYEGTLYVPGAEKDCERIENFIIKNINEIDHISFTMDTHQPNSIFHPSFWLDKNGNHPSPFTIIKHEDIKNGIWRAIYQREGEEYVNFIEDLAKEEEKNGIIFPIYNHMIWPEHCILGTEGWLLHQGLMNAIIKWSHHNPYRVYNAEVKGDYILSEHYGIFESQRPTANVPSTNLNFQLIKVLEEYENVFLIGEARSHCVATSLKQAIYKAPDLAKKFVILTDCMSDVQGAVNGVTFGEISQPIYDLAKSMGVRFEKSTDVVLASSQHPAMSL